MSMIKAIVESVNEHNDRQEEKIAKLEELIREYRSRILLHTNEETLFAIDQDVADWKFRTEEQDKLRGEMPLAPKNLKHGEK